MKWWFACPLFFSSLYPNFAVAMGPGTIEKNNEGILRFQKEDYYGSYQKFAESLSEAPFNPSIHLNLGLSYYKNEEKDKALQSFQSALKMAQEQGLQEPLFAALFNTAAAHSVSGEIDMALQLYQQALKLKPGDKQVRENIEKIWQAQQGGGKGEGEDKDKKPNDQDENQQAGADQNQDPQNGKEPDKKKPKPFESKDLSQDDVRKILEEIKNQEQKIRADVYEGKAKDSPNAKDW
ncbi:MAG: tetratricopeptide repeat protein [Pseudomonadota bacterium]